MMIISIKKALNCIPNDISNIYIHDAARFMITKDHLDNLSSTNKLYSQYVIKLTNGLTNIKLYHDIERNDYLELCTPIYINVSLAKYIYNNFIPNFTYEVIYLLNVLDIDYDLIDGHLSFLKKLTYIEDINMIP
jgi:2-C-methyl-D-erythritol 4-phosphate cytidylyltransferase